MTTLAYLDPGSAGIMLQMLAGGVAAFAVTIGVFWRKLLRFLHIKRDKPEGTPPPETR